MNTDKQFDPLVGMLIAVLLSIPVWLMVAALVLYLQGRW